LRPNKVYEGNLEFETFVCGVRIEVPRSAGGSSST
jgi:hypothetical protein